MPTGAMNAGTAANAIPDSAGMGGSLRTSGGEPRAFIKQQTDEIGEGARPRRRSEAAALVNGGELSLCCGRYARALPGEKAPFPLPGWAPWGGATAPGTMGRRNRAGRHGRRNRAGHHGAAQPHQKRRFGGFCPCQSEGPSLMLAPASGQAENDHRFPQHHSMVQSDESILPIGRAVYAYTARKPA